MNFVRQVTSLIKPSSNPPVSVVVDNHSESHRGTVEAVHTTNASKVNFADGPFPCDEVVQLINRLDKPDNEFSSADIADNLLAQVLAHQPVKALCAPLNSCITLPCPPELSSLHKFITSSTQGAPILCDTGCEFSVFPESFVNSEPVFFPEGNLKTARKFILSYYNCTRMSLDSVWCCPARTWDAIENRELTPVAVWDKNQVILGRDILVGLCGMATNMVFNGVCHDLDTGSSVNVTPLSHTHTLHRPQTFNGVPSDRVHIDSGVAYFSKPGFVRPVLSANIAGLQIWPYSELMPSQYHTGSPSKLEFLANSVITQSKYHTEHVCCMADAGKQRKQPGRSRIDSSQLAGATGDQKAELNKAVGALKAATKSIAETKAGMNKSAQAKKLISNSHSRWDKTLDKLPHSALATENFGTSGYQLSRLQALASTDIATPASFLDSLAKLSTGDVTTLKKRFGAPGETAVFEQTCTVMFPMSSVSAGDTVILAVPFSWGNRGGILYKRAGGTGIPVVIGYMPPNVDIEAFSTAHSVLGVHMELTMPTTYGGSSAIVSQVQFERGLYQVNPAALTAGQTERMAIGRKAPIGILGADVAKLDVVDYVSDAFDAIRETGFDTALTYLYTPSVPNPTCLASPTRARGYNISTSASAIGSLPSESSGFLTWPASVSLPSNVTVPLYSLKKLPEFYRHVIFGDFTYSYTIGLSGNNTNVFNYLLKLTATYADGSFITMDAGAASVPISISHAVTATGRVCSLGASEFSSKRGLPIVDITLSATCMGTTGSTSATVSSFRYDVLFHDVNPRETYLGWILSGVSPVQTAQFVYKAGVEVWSDPATPMGQIVKPTMTPPVGRQMAIDTLFAAKVAGIIDNEHVLDTTPMETGSFKNAVTRIRKAVGHIVKEKSQPFLAQLDSTGAAHRALFGSTTFGEGARSSARTGFSCPAVTHAADGENFLAERVEVIKGDGISEPDWASGFSLSDLHTVGKSWTLSVALALLAKVGVPVKMGMYTGEVTEVSYNIQSKHAWIAVRPVASAPEKLSAFPDLVGLFQDGWYKRGVFLADDGLNAIFGRSVAVTLMDKDELPHPYPEGSCEYNLELQW